MKRLILLLTLLPFFAIGQNWAPLNPNDIYNYQEATDNYITTSIRVDSFSMDQQDSIFYLNRMIKECEGCSFIMEGCEFCNSQLEDSVLLINQEDFLNLSFVRKADGRYIFSGANTFQIYPLAEVDDTWVFDSINNVQATVIIQEEILIFDQIDSCKYILLSTNDTIKLSKNFGLVDFNYQNKHYGLTGIQTRSLGELVPTWIDFHNFAVGDVFQYDIYNQSLDNVTYGINKFSILEKIENDSQIVYTYHQIRSETNQVGAFGITYTRNESTYNRILNKNQSFPFEGKYNKQLATWNVGNIFSCGQDMNEITPVRPIQMRKNETNQQITMGTGNIVFDYSLDAVKTYGQMINSDTIAQNYCMEDLYYVYATGLGEVFYQAEVLDNRNSRRLIGYIKDSDTTGIITPNGILLVATERLNESTTITFDIQPNPVSDKVSLYFKNEIPSVIQILSLDGRLMREVKISNNTEQIEINLKELTSGLYLVKAKYEQFERIRKVVKR